MSSNAFTRPEKKKKAKIPEEEAEECSGTFRTYSICSEGAIA